jgi:hypothetical protein
LVPAVVLRLSVFLGVTAMEPVAVEWPQPPVWVTV